MVTIQYYENNSLFLCQLVHKTPSVDENIRIKGKNAKVIRVNEVNEKSYSCTHCNRKDCKKAFAIKRITKEKTLNDIAR